jgi:hypothetical protein
MALMKKAFFLTFIAIMVVSLFVVVFATNLNVSTPETSQSSWARIDSIDRYTKDIRYLYLKRALTASSDLAIESMSDYMFTRHVPMQDVEANFTELVMYGTLSGVPQPKMVNMTLLNWSRRISNLSRTHLGIDTNITPRYIIIDQTMPWAINVQAGFSVVINRSEVFYRFDTHTDINLSVIDRWDPLHLVHGYNRSIRITNITNWTNESLPIHLNHSWYRHIEATGSSFLMRLENRSGESPCCGIESLLNDSYTLYNRSYRDYQYWNGTVDMCTIGVPNVLFNITKVIVLPGFGDFRLGRYEPLYYGLNTSILDTPAIC